MAFTVTNLGGVTVNQGDLNVAGMLSTLVLNVNAGGSLMGGRQIVAAVNMNAGSFLRPGNSPGTLTVIGTPVVMNAGSTYEADIDGRVYDAAGGAGTYDRVALTAGATFTAGGTLAPLLRGITGSATNTFTPILGDRFRIVDGGAVSGAFDTVTQPSAGLAANTRFDVLYNPTSIDLVVTPGSFATYGATAGWRANAVSVGRALDAVRPAAGSRTGTLQGLFDSVYGYDSAGYATALEQLSGEVHAEAMSVAAGAANNTSTLVLGAAGATLGEEGCAEGKTTNGKCIEPTGRPGLWTQLFYEKTRVGSDRISAGFDNEQRGFAAGIHLINAPETRIGVGGRYSDNDLTNAVGSTANANGYTLFGYASHDFGPLTVAATVGWGTTEIESRRAQTLLTGGAVATADYKLQTVNAALEARHTLPLGTALLRPVVGISHEHVSTGATRETSTDANVALNLPHSTWSTTRTKLGATAEVPLGPIALTANGAWQHVIDGDATAARPVTLGTAAWTVSSVGAKKDSYTFGAGFAARVGPRTTIRMEYAGLRDGGSYKSDQGFFRLSHAF